MSENIYPRSPQSGKVVHEKDWNQGAPFGHCPACGSLGIEELHSSRNEPICFFCSDKNCQTIMGERSPARTRWNQGKPPDILKKEAEGWTWNDEYFPERDDHFSTYTY